MHSSSELAAGDLEQNQLSKNKIDGTANSREHRSPHPVDGRAMHPCEENFE
jgi:hypothetical protein